MYRGEELKVQKYEDKSKDQKQQKPKPSQLRKVKKKEIILNAAPLHDRSKSIDLCPLYKFWNDNGVGFSSFY